MRQFDKTLWVTTRIPTYRKGCLTDSFRHCVPAYRLRFQVPVHQNTMQRRFRIIREVIRQECLRELCALTGLIGADWRFNHRNKILVPLLRKNMSRQVIKEHIKCNFSTI
ncbi:MAG: hypothetical protein ACM337_05610 [Syntrophaceae bacterium]